MTIGKAFDTIYKIKPLKKIMKSLLLFLTITFTLITSVNSQNIDGIYTNKWESKSGETLAYTLTLNPDGTFIFESERISLPPDMGITSNVIGTWNLTGHLLVLSTDSNTDFSSNLNNSKARYVSVSPRNPKFNLVKPSLHFYQSDVFYAKDMKLHKEESTVTSINSNHQ